MLVLCYLDVFLKAQQEKKDKKSHEQNTHKHN